MTTPQYVKCSAWQDDTADFTRRKKGSSAPFFSVCQSFNCSVLIILVDADISQRNGDICVIKYLFERNRIMRLLVHVIPKCFTQRMGAYAADPKLCPCLRQNIVCLLAADRPIGEVWGFKQIFKIFFPLYVIPDYRFQLLVQGEALFFSCFFLIFRR